MNTTASLHDATTTSPSTSLLADLDVQLEQHRVGLTGYCYRMLGSAFDADDAVQETFLRAWRSAASYEGRAPFKSWLYRIATNVCFDLLNGRMRRAMPMDFGASGDGLQPAGPSLPEHLWLQPIPDSLVIAADDPAERAAARETVRLAFIAALQHLQPRQRAVLILRDVLAWQATEVADLLSMTPTSVHSMLLRARRRLADHHTDPDGHVDQELLTRYVDAFERYDIEALVALLHHDATLSMPPHLLWMQGRESIRRWWSGPGMACAGSRIRAVSANGEPALAFYKRTESDTFSAFAIQVIEARSGRVAAMHTFIEADLFRLFDLPPTLA